MTWTPEAPPQLQANEKVAIDYEYRGDPSGRTCQPFAVSVWSPARNRGWYLPWGHKGGGNLDEGTVKRWFTTELAGRDIYGLNIKADLHATAQWGIDAESLGIRPHDVGFMSALLEEERLTKRGYFGFSLESLAEHYLSFGERKVHPSIAPENFGEVHAGEIAERGISDSLLTWRLQEVLSPEIAGQNLERVLALEDSIIYAVVGMERNGFRIDRSKLEQWLRDIPILVAKLRGKVKDATGIQVNPRGSKSMKELFDKLALPYPQVWDEEKSRFRNTFDAEHLDNLKHPILNDLRAMRVLESMMSKFFSKYLEALDSNNIIHFQLNQLKGESTDDAGADRGTVTGRFSSGGDEFKNNIQQVPKCDNQIKVNKLLDLPPWLIARVLFLPIEGQLLAASDASQIEFRMFAHFSHRASLISVEYAVGTAKKPEQKNWLRDNFGPRLKAIREANKLTQGNAVLRLNGQITQNDLSKWERGRTSPDPYRLALVLGAYKKVDFRWLFDLKPDVQWKEGLPCALPGCTRIHNKEKWLRHYHRARKK